MTDDAAVTGDEVVTSDDGSTFSDDSSFDRRRRLVLGVAAATVVVVSAVLLARLLAPMRFVFDDWVFIGTRHDLTVDNVLRSHNGHPVMLPALVYMLGFHTAGLHDLWYYRIALILAHLALCAVLATRVWRRHGVVPAAAVWLLVCFMGAGATNITWPFQISLVGSVLFFVLAVDALERLRERGRRRDGAWVSAMVTGSLLCSAVGIAVMAAVALVVVAGRDRRRDWWVPVVPTVLFALWWSAYHDDTKGTTDVHAVSRALWQSVQAAGAAIMAGNERVGGWFVVALFVAAAVALVRRRVALHQTIGLVFVGTFWVMTASTRALQLLMLGLKSPARYQYVAVVALLVALSDLAPSARAATRSIARTTVIGVVCMAVAVSSVWSGHALLIRERDQFVAFGQRTAAQLTVIDAHPDAFADDRALVSLLGDPLITMGEYRAASRAVDSTGGLTSAELVALPDDREGSAEELMLPLLQVSARETTACTVGADVRSVTLEPGGSIDVAATADTTLTASRWLAPDPDGKGVHPLAAGGWTIASPADRLDPAWTLTFAQPVQVLDCG